MEEDREILQDFIQESTEAIAHTELTLLKLEDLITRNEFIDPADINSIFRTFHSIKGSAGFIGLEKTNTLTHDAENLLDLIRKEKITFQKEHIDIFLEVCDFLQQLLEYMNDQATEEGFEGDVGELRNRLQGHSSPAAPVEAKPAVQAVPAAVPVQAAKPAGKPGLPTQESLITPEMVAQFINDSAELIEHMEQDLLALEKEPANSELVQSAFRSLHSLKGNAGFFNYTDINMLAHRAETFLDNVRSGRTIAESSQISMILQVLDFISAALQNLREGRPPLIPGKHGLLDLMQEIFQLQEEPAGETPKAAPKTAPPAAAKPEQTRKEMDNEPPAVMDSGKTSAAKAQSAAGAETNTEAIRVDVIKLNRLMDLVGEIVIGESMVSQHPWIAGHEGDGLERSLDYLQKNIRELQDLATSMRMVPLSGLFGKMRRLVRDISSKKQNKVELEVNGGETEVDRSVIEHISDPLVHMLRNSIDHGIEMPDERVAKGKNATGHLVLSARRIGGEIWITIEDDGAGLNKERIIKKAKERGLIKESDDEPTDEQIYALIFKPGFSTAQQVTNLSGRGVGMDVVLKNIEKIRGRVDLKSQQDNGTTVTLKIPLTTAIIDGMLMRVGETLYAIPTLDILQSIQVRSEQIVNLADGQEVIKLRKTMVPVIRLQEIHEIETTRRALEDSIVVVTENAGKAYGFLVDEIIGQQQLVIKPMPKYLGSIDGVSGCAVLGNGEICLILDLSNMVKAVEKKAQV